MSRNKLKVLVVGVCASGKTSLVEALRARGIDAHHAAQEHSNVPWMWKMSKPDFLIVLQAKYETIKKRRDIPWNEKRYWLEVERLRGAKENANLIIDTDNLTKEEVAEIALNALNNYFVTLGKEKLR
ncbi:MAG TPA: hypothetical protein GXX38_02365 [Clostridia bacterium]|nr:hypothetical protein [Clostridia bacterium]